MQQLQQPVQQLQQPVQLLQQPMQQLQQPVHPLQQEIIHPDINAAALGNRIWDVEHQAHQPSTVKDWHQSITPGRRNYLINALVEAIFPASGCLQMNEDRFTNIFQFARLVEGRIYEGAESRPEYYQQLAEKIIKIQLDLNKKKLNRMKQENSQRKTIYELLESRMTIVSGNVVTSGGDVKSVYKFTHAGSVLAAMKSQRDKGQLLDFTLKVEGVSIPVHRALLSGFSPYFEAYFRNDKTNSGICVLPPQMKENAVRSIIDFAYSEHLEIFLNGVYDLLLTADFLMVDTICIACKQFLLERLTLDNCFDILHIATHVNVGDFREKVMKFILEHFEQVMLSAGILFIQSEMMLEILKRDDLVLTKNGFLVLPEQQEEMILRLVLIYLEVSGNSKLLFEFLKTAVRLPLLTRSFLLTMKKEMLTKSPECLVLIDSALVLQSSNNDGLNAYDANHLLPNKLRSFTCLEYASSLQISPFRSFSPDSHLEVFTDASLKPDHCLLYVTGMKLYIRRCDGRPAIGGIRVSYSSGASVLHGSDNFGYEVNEFTLEPDERIVWVAVGAGWVVESFTFKTNKSRQFGRYGGAEGKMPPMEPPCKIGGFLAFFEGSVEMIEGGTAILRLRINWGYSNWNQLGSS